MTEFSDANPLLLSESIESVAARTYDELRRKELPPEDEGIVEPKALQDSTGGRVLLVGGILLLLFLIFLKNK
jgi:hypothetical protein